MEFVVRSLTGLGHATTNTSSGKFWNSTQASPTPTSFRLGTAVPSGASLHFANATQTAARFNSSVSLNATRTPDLNNATECLMEYWAYSHSQTSWYQAQHTTYAINATYTDVVTTTVPSQPLGNLSYTVLCDGLPRFKDVSDEAEAVVTLPTPITKTYVRSQYTIEPIGTEEDPYTNWPKCTINPGEECGNLWKIFATSLRSTLVDWSSTNVLTISVAPTPTVMTVNGEATPLTAAPGQLPTLPIHGNLYAAGADSIWSIDDAYNFVGETFISPGQQVTFTWNAGSKPKPFGPSNQNCSRPSGTIIESACSKTAACTITANSVDLLYFPPPSTTRDICANTSPGFNKYKQSVYKQPHESVVINSTTFWKDKAYVRYDTVSAYKRCEADNGLQTLQTAVGGTYTNTFVEVESSDLSTICGWQMNPTRPYGLVIGATPVPVNFDDFNGPVPESAYQCLQGCGMRDGCSSIVQSLWNPNLAVPPQVRALDPEWSGCVPYFEGTHDPPIALSSAGDFFTTTNPGQMPTPGVSPSANLPIETGRPGDSPGSNPANPSDPSGPSDPGNTPQNPPGDNDPPSSPPQRPSQDPGIRPPPLTTSFTENIPLPTAPTQPNNPSNPPGDNSPSRPNNPPIDSPDSPSNNPPNGPSNNPPGNPPSNPPNNQPSNPITTIGNQPIIADPSQPGVVIIGTPGSPSATVLRPGAPPIVISGTTLSISPSGTALSISGTTNLNPITTINGQPVYIDPAQPGRVVVGDPSNPSAQQTYSINNDGMIVISGTTLSMASAATAVAQSGGVTPTTVIISGLPITLHSDGSLSIVADGVTHTLRPGAPQISVNGHSISLGPAGEVVVDGQPHKLNTNVTPDTIVIIGPDGSRTTVPMSQATATQSPTVAEQRIASSLSEESGSRGPSSREASASITAASPGGSGGNKDSSPTSKGGATSCSIGVVEKMCIGVGLSIVFLGIF